MQKRCWILRILDAILLWILFVCSDGIFLVIITFLDKVSQRICLLDRCTSQNVPFLPSASLQHRKGVPSLTILYKAAFGITILYKAFGNNPWLKPLQVKVFHRRIIQGPKLLVSSVWRCQDLGSTYTSDHSCLLSSVCGTIPLLLWTLLWTSSCK